jgi:hypothetical protein
MESPETANEANGHFDDKAWLDLAKEAVEPGRAAQMHAHLDSGCESCRNQYAMWRLVLETAERESEYEPPDATVRAVRDAFSLSRKLPYLPLLADLAQLISDSFLEPLPAGVRGAPSMEARHLLHESGDLVIDMRLENEGHNVTSLAGQILQKNAPVETTAGTGVVLVQGHDNLVGHTIANSMGEFQLEFESTAELTVFLEVPGGRIVSVALPVAEP